MAESRPIPKLYYDQAFALSYYSEILWQKSFVEGNGGNLSIRLDEDLFMITPSMHSKSGLNETDFVIVDSKGNKIYGSKKASTELFTHLSIYNNNPDIGGIVHSHPPYTCSYAFSETVPATPMSAESVIWMGQLTLAQYNTPGSAELLEQVETLSKGRNVLILQNHGLLTWGKNIEEAYWRTEVVEAHCKISHIMESRGSQPRHFTYKQMTQLNELRGKFTKNE